MSLALRRRRRWARPSALAGPQRAPIAPAKARPSRHQQPVSGAPARPSRHQQPVSGAPARPRRHQQPVSGAPARPSRHQQPVSGAPARPSRHQQPVSGFTLIELLVALAVFAVISSIVYTGLSSVLTASETTRGELERLGEVQRAATLLERDLGQLVDRPVRDGFGDHQPPVLLEEGRLWVTAGGTRNPLGQQRSALRRVGYALSDDAELIRYTFEALDQPIDPERIETVALTAVREWRLRFRHEGEWIEQWPPLDGDPATAARLPRAIAVQLTLEDYGAIERTFAR